MSVGRYYRLAMRQSTNWLRACLASPSSSMRPIHLTVIRVAIRTKTSGDAS